jgi:hypothetical protein
VGVGELCLLDNDLIDQEAKLTTTHTTVNTQLHPV